MSSASKLFTILAALTLLVATMLGAYSSHALAGLEPRALGNVTTAVEYQFYHGLALLGVALLVERIGGRGVQLAGALFFAGIVLFCGGIYASVLLGFSAAGSVTPFGGGAFMAGWIALVVAAARARKIDS